MGGCASSAKDPKTGKAVHPIAHPVAQGKGVIPKKIESVKNKNVTVMDIVYLFGGSKILQFNVKEMKIENIPAQPTVVVPKRTQCEYLMDIHKIATLGGTIEGKITNVGYLFDPKDWTKAVKLPDFPKPIRATTLAYVDHYLYSIGGETDGADPDNILTDVYKLKIGPELGTAWELVCQLPIKRRSANVMVANGNIYVFGGYSGKDNRSTQIDFIDTKTGKSQMETYRLPLGVEGARMCWHGDDILLVGGKRIATQPDANVLIIDFKKKAIMSMRDLNTARDFPLVIPTKIDEVIVFGGAHHRTAELRSWNAELGDYDFKPFHVKGEELIESPNSYDSALPTFMDVVSDKDLFPDFASDSRIIFGNEVDCFLIELTKNLTANFYKSPMRLQQKTGQNTVRTDANTIYLAGGTDTSRTKISSKVYRFLFSTKEVTELPKLNTGRYYPVMVNEGKHFFVVGGNVKGGQPTNAVEYIDFGAAPDQQKWELTPPMKHARCGHLAWVSHDKLYVMGGTSQQKGKPIEEVEVYDIATKTWSIHPSKLSIKKL